MYDGLWACSSTTGEGSKSAGTTADCWHDSTTNHAGSVDHDITGSVRWRAMVESLLMMHGTLTLPATDHCKWRSLRPIAGPVGVDWCGLTFDTTERSRQASAGLRQLLLFAVRCIRRHFSRWVTFCRSIQLHTGGDQKALLFGMMHKRHRQNNCIIFQYYLPSHQHNNCDTGQKGPSFQSNRILEACCQYTTPWPAWTRHSSQNLFLRRCFFRCRNR